MNEEPKTTPVTIPEVQNTLLESIKTLAERAAGDPQPAFAQAAFDLARAYALLK